MLCLRFFAFSSWHLHSTINGKPIDSNPTGALAVLASTTASILPSRPAVDATQAAESNDSFSASPMSCWNASLGSRNSDARGPCHVGPKSKRSKKARCISRLLNVPYAAIVTLLRRDAAPRFAARARGSVTRSVLDSHKGCAEPSYKAADTARLSASASRCKRRGDSIGGHDVQQKPIRTKLLLRRLWRPELGTPRQ